MTQRPASPPPSRNYTSQYRRELVAATAPLAFAAFIQHHGRPPTDQEMVDIDYAIDGYCLTVYPTPKEPNR